MKLFRPALKVSRWRSDLTTIAEEPAMREAIDAGMYSLIATLRCSEWSQAR